MGKKLLSSFVLSAVVLALGFGLLSAKSVYATSNENENHNSNKNTSVSPAYIACLKTAIGKRDTALKTDWDTFASSVSTAFGTRKTALLAAYDLTTNAARRDAIKDAWKAFKKSRRDARRTFNRARHEAWTTFSSDRRTCKAPMDGIGASVDSEPQHQD
jgi:hypothetical protein